jgi:hypothetical protein
MFYAVTHLGAGAAFALYFLAIAALACFIEWVLAWLVNKCGAKGALVVILKATSVCLAGIDCGLLVKLVLLHALGSFELV